MIPLSALFPRYEEEVALRATAENEFVALHSWRRRRKVECEGQEVKW